MNVYKVSWIAKGQPHSLVGVAGSPAQLSAYVKELDPANHVVEVALLHSDAQLFFERMPSPPPATVPKPQAKLVEKATARR